MSQSGGNTSAKKLVHIDISFDTVCPWCFVGKKHLDKAIAASKDQFDFEIRYHPFFLERSAPKEGVSLKEFYQMKFGSRCEAIFANMSKIFRGLEMEYNTSGLTGSTLDSHRLIYFAGTQAPTKQHDLVEELALGYFTEGKYIGDLKFLVESARKVGIEGAEEFLKDPENGANEVNEDFKKYSANISGVPYYVINGKQKLSGAQSPETFQRAFQAAAK